MSLENPLEGNNLLSEAADLKKHLEVDKFNLQNFKVTYKNITGCEYPEKPDHMDDVENIKNAEKMRELIEILEKRIPENQSKLDNILNQ